MIGVLAALLLVLGAIGAFALVNDSGTYDVTVPDDTQCANATLTPGGALVAYIGDACTSYGAAGTGTFGTFVQIQNSPTEQGYNTDHRPAQFDEGNSAQFNRHILLSGVPVVEDSGKKYWEFFADINDSNAKNDPAAKQISLDRVQLYFTTDPSITGYDTSTHSFGAAATKVYDFTGTIKINDVNQGSGRGDLRYLIPIDSTTLPANCNYGNPACATYVVLYSEWGNYTDFQSDSGFEEWKVKVYPILQVSKTVNGSYDTPVSWDITKTVSPSSWDLFTGESGTSKYTVSVDRTNGTAENTTVYGVITIVGDDKDDVDATVTDAFEGDDATITGCSVAQNIDGTYTIASKATVTCDYTLDLAGSPVAGDNVATASYETSGITLTFTGTAHIDVGDYVESFTGDPTSINVTDTNGQSWGPVSDDTSWNYDKTFTCDTDEGITNNTATITETGDNDSAAVTVSCNQLSVTKDASTSLTRTWTWTIDKQQDDSWALFTGESGTSDFDVTVDASSSDGTYGVTGNIHVANTTSLDATLNSVSDMVSGSIAGSVSCADVDLAGGYPYTLGAGDTLDCTYSASLPDGTGRTNTATATQQLHNYSSTLVQSDDGTKDYTGTANVVFDSSTTVTDKDAQVTVTDDNWTPGDTTDDVTLGTVDATSDTLPYSFPTYHRTFACDADEGSHTNTASFVTNDTSATGSSSATVDVSCYDLTVTKDASTSLTRTWKWTIDKRAWYDDGGSKIYFDTLTLPDQTPEVLGGTTVTFGYDVTVDLDDPSYADSNWAVSGSIKISNNHPSRAAELTQVLDEVSGSISATVTCPASSVPAAGSLTCTYSTTLPDGADRTNTATATQQLYDYESDHSTTSDAGTTDYTGNADVVFDSETQVNDADGSVDVYDSWMGTTYPICGLDALTGVSVTRGGGACSSSTVAHGDAPVTFVITTSMAVDDMVCEYNEFPNYAAIAATGDPAPIFTTGDLTWSGELAEARDTAAFYKVCIQGCSLTQGYWKTHSLDGPVPPKKADPYWLEFQYWDEGWSPLGDFLDYQSDFFASGYSWRDVMWVAPKGDGYYILASQYVAAQLNVYANYAENGTSVPAEVQTLLEQATDIMEGNDGLKGKKGDDAKYIASQLDLFNQGLLIDGWGHCVSPIG